MDQFAASCTRIRYGPLPSNIIAGCLEGRSAIWWREIPLGNIMVWNNCNITFISRLNALDYTKLRSQNLCCIKIFKRHKIKNHSMFRIVCDPSSGGIELYLTEIRSGSSQTVVPYTHTTGSKLRCQTPTKHTTNISEPLRIISVKYSSILPDDGSHTIRNMSEWFLILCLLNFYTT